MGILRKRPTGTASLPLTAAGVSSARLSLRRLGTTFIHVTHDQEEAMAIADRIVVMNHGQIEDIGPPQDIYLRPKSLFSAAFMGEINLIPATPNGLGIDTPLGPLAVPPSSNGMKCSRSIRPSLVPQ